MIPPNISKDQYAALLKFLSLTAISSTDLLLNNGNVCQASDKKTSILTSNVNSVLPTISLAISSIPSKNQLLNMLLGSDVALEIDEHNWSITDNKTKLKFKKTNPRMLTNVQWDETKLNINLPISEEQKIMQIDLDKLLLSRIGTSANVLKSEELELNLKQNNIAIKLSGAAKSATVSLITIEAQSPIIGIAQFPISCISSFLSAGTEEVKLELYSHPTNSSQVIMTTSATITSAQTTIPVKIYSLANVLN